MSVKLRISITKETLQETKSCSSLFVENCAIAHEVRKIFNTAKVGSENVLFYTYTGVFTSPLPKSAIEFIKVFDFSPPKERTKLTPFSFEIAIPDDIINNIDISEIEKIPTLELI